MRKFFWFIVVVLAVTFSGFFGFGMNLPQKHAFTVDAVYAAPHEKVWKAIADYKHLPSWSNNVVSTKRLHDLEGQPLWRINSHYGRYMDVHVVDEDPEFLHVSEIIDGNYPFAGVWRFRLVKGQDDKILVELTEEGTIESPFWRVVIRHVIGQERAARAFLREMGEYVEKPDVVETVEKVEEADKAEVEDKAKDSKEAEPKEKTEPTEPKESATQ